MDESIAFLWKTGSCNTGPCPALFTAPGGYYVQHKRVTDPAVRSRLSEIGAASGNPLAEDEDYGFVNRDVIERIRDHSAVISADDLGRALRDSRSSAFRLDTVQDALPGERPEFARFLAGSPAPPDQVSWWREWLGQVRGLAGAGRTVSRVRILAEPPTDYQRWQLWAAPWHARAGEDIGYLARSTAEQIGLPVNRDWWLLDDERVILIRFGRSGELAGLENVTDPAAVRGYRAWRDLAVRHARPAGAYAVLPPEGTASWSRPGNGCPSPAGSPPGCGRRGRTPG